MNIRSTTNYLYSYDNFNNWITKDQSLNGEKKAQERTQIEYFKKSKTTTNNW